MMVVLAMCECGYIEFIFFYFSFCVCAARVLKAAHFLLCAISWNCVCTRTRSSTLSRTRRSHADNHNLIFIVQVFMDIVVHVCNGSVYEEETNVI